MASTKIKTLWIYKLLVENSDESHPISTTELIEMLRQNGVKCERKSSMLIFRHLMRLDLI